MLFKTPITLLFLVCVFASLSVSSKAQAVVPQKLAGTVGVGAAAPDFTLADQNGQKRTLSAEIGQRPVVLVFYRGHWCPYCARQLADLRSLVKPDEPVTLWAISVDASEKSKALGEKIAADGKGKVMYPLLSDPKQQVIDAYGLRDPRYAGEKVAGIPYPAVYVIDKKGKVAWVRVEMDYKQRPTTAEIRSAVDAVR